MKTAAMRIPLLLLVAAVSTGCTTDDETAFRVLDGAGYTKVQLGQLRWFGCGKGDKFGKSFDAVGPTGRQVSGIVCGGILKGSTVRLD